jgi:AcrR family transcriptional regulator
MDKNINETKKECIIKLALKQFVDKGYEGATVREIAQGAAINPAMISYYFGSKENLLNAILIHYIHLMNNVWLSLKNDKQTSISPSEELSIIIDTFIEKAISWMDIYFLMVREYRFISSSKELSSHIMELQNNVLAVLGDCITRGIENGDFQKDIDTQFVKQMMFGTFIQALIINDFNLKEINYNSLLESIEKLRLNLKFILKCYFIA